MFHVVLNGKPSQECPLMLEYHQKDSSSGPTLFPLYINDLPDQVASNLATHTDVSTLESKCDA